MIEREFNKRIPRDESTEEQKELWRIIDSAGSRANNASEERRPAGPARDELVTTDRTKAMR